MRIGIDLDNTIVCYDGVFHKVALERRLIPSALPTTKNAVRDYLNDSGRKDAFTELQGHVYGTRMDLAAPYAGAREFIVAGGAAGHQLFIVSHKTKNPMLGPRHDLHAAALHFLEARQLVGKGAISASNVFLEPTREGKVARVADLNCQVFIDDLPEVLSSPGFPAGLRAILFDPEGTFNGDAFEAYRDWARIAVALLGSRD
jgi:hypothetical protein